jgi:hypothetical protein
VLSYSGPAVPNGLALDVLNASVCHPAIVADAIKHLQAGTAAVTTSVSLNFSQYLGVATSYRRITVSDSLGSVPV